MPKNLLQDMVRIKNPAREKEILVAKKMETERKIVREEEIHSSSSRTRQNNKGSKYRIYFIALISVIFLLFALSYLFSEAKVTITPKVKDVPLSSENLSATKDSNTQDLPFDLVVLSGEESKSIQGGEVQNVAIAATGTVTVFNSFSTSPQVLALGTHLEGSNGKIYKTNKKVTIPGIAKDGKPGSIAVDIYGADAGAEYNSSKPVDFKIVSFKGTSKYNKIFAESDPNGDITGGFKGQSPLVSDLDKVTAVSELKSTLESKLVQKATDQIPDGFILFKDATFLDIKDSDINFIPDKNNMVLTDVKGTLYGFLFDEKKLTTKLAEDVVENYDGGEVYIPNIRDLTFTLTDKENTSFADVQTINFSLAGIPKIIWKVDKDKLVADMLNKKKSDFNQILSQHPEIDTAVLVLRPFWKTTFPDVSKDIQVIVNYPN